MIRPTRFIVTAAALVAGACVTINVYFPEAAIRDMSQQIENQIQESAADAEAAPATQDSAHLWFPFEGVAYAAEVAAPEITNPAIRKIIASRAARVKSLNEFKAKGVIGENAKALVEAKNLGALKDLKARATAQRLIKQENADRMKLFKEIAAAKKVDQSQLGKIQKTYAETLRKRARKGDWVQMPSGQWKQK